MREAAQDARGSSSDPGRGQEISDAARAALGKPEQAVVSAEGLLASLSGMSALSVGPAGETAVTLVTRAAGAPNGMTATTTIAPTGTTATTGTNAMTTTTVPTGSTATSTVLFGGTYTVIVTSDTTIRRNDGAAKPAALQAGDEVVARGSLDSSTLTATRVLADGPAPVGTPATTTNR